MDASPSFEWDIQTVDSVEHVGGYTSIVLDSSGNPLFFKTADGLYGGSKHISSLDSISVPLAEISVGPGSQIQTWITIAVVVISLVIGGIIIVKSG
ncbi:MAG: hypothetical protein AB1476_01660 [Candidatus Hadarchaeota archaeon]